MKRISLPLFIFFSVQFLSAKLFADTIPFVNVIEQKIVYNSTNATEVTLVWGINEWQVPPDSLRPANSYLKSGVLYTVMQGTFDSFVINIKVPVGTYINYIFWLSKDRKGKQYNFWDKNGGHNYSVYVKSGGGAKVHIDTYSKISDKAFFLLQKSPLIFFISVIFSLFLAYFYRKKKFFQHSVHQPTLLLGTGFSVFLIMLLARLQMNEITQQRKVLLPGAVFYDLIFLFFFVSIAFILFKFLRNPFLKNILFGLMFILLLFAGFIAILNTEIVKFLGTPLNYQWMYYSGFLKSADAKAAIASNMSGSITLNICLLTLSFIVAGGAFSGFFSIHKKNRILLWGGLFIIIVCMVMGKIQANRGLYIHSKIDNPIVAFFLSWIKAGERDNLFTVKVEDTIRKEMEAIHTSGEITFLNKNNSIKNVVIFVIESAPAEYIDVYDSTFRATPNLLKWKKNSRVFKNIYAHVPATSNSLFSLVSGLYPEISYRLITNERPDLPVTSLASLLHKNNWQSGSFNAMDMNYGGMGNYLEKNGFTVIKDFKKINCPYQKFSVDWEYLDGIDDRCMVNSALEWINSTKKNTLTVCWTMQTHYPYFFSGVEEQFNTANKDFNRYLNALKNTDEALGILMDGLRKENKLDETLIIVVGDHGEAFGRHNQTTHGSKVYEENLHIPLMLINPKFFHGESDERIGGLIDIAPTVSDILGIMPPPEWEGKSLINDQPKNRTFFFCPYSDFLFGTRIDNWKYIYNASTTSSELYDLSKDPKESINLALENKSFVDKQYQYLAAWIQFHTKKLNSFE